MGTLIGGAARLMRAATLALVLALGGYLLVLVRRTGWLAYSTSVGSDVIVGFHVVGVAAVLAAALSPGRSESRAISALSWSACLVELTFLALNLSGKVWEYRKGEPDSLYALVVRVVRGILR